MTKDPSLPSVFECERAGSMPARIGPYKLERVLGKGGMGTVYLAVRDDDHFRKHVALKLMRPDLAGPELRNRFRGERQILALLNHPNIAALADGGETEDGHLYEVMEYVAGSPIDSYCRALQLGVRERLRLFLDVCAAVAHAHRYLVVHRDIKPDNVFVTNEGTVKLLDFGIAKILRPEMFHLPNHLTRAEHAPCTPLYASPEQIKCEPVSTASDIYSLGVLLFELLTGTLPYRETSHETELAAAIRDLDPLKPSEVAETEHRRRELEGDLDNIILMALRKEPDRRYTSVDQFASDIRRHLEGFPVRARKSSARYRMEKFIRRNTVPVAAAATVAVVLAGSAWVTWRSAAEARRERDTARAVAAFLAGIFEENDPGQARGRDLTAREVLERGVARIDTELAGRPEVQGILLNIAGRTFRHMGDTVRGRALLEQALDLRTRTFGREHAETAETLVNLGRLEVVTGRYAEGVKLLEEAAAIHRKLTGGKSVAAAEAGCYLGLGQYYQWRLKDARSTLETSLKTLEGLGLGEENEVYRQSLHNLTLVWQETGSPDLAESGRRRLLAVDRKLLGEHPNVALELASLGYLLTKQRKLAEAEPLLREALAMQSKLVPNGVERAHIMQYLAMCLRMRGRLEEAEQLWEQLIPIHIKHLGEENRFVASDWLEYGELKRAQRDWPAAERYLLKALALRRKKSGREHVTVSQVLSSLGRLAQDRGDYAAAVANFREALRIRELKAPEDKASIEKAREHLAKAAGQAQAAAAPVLAKIR